MKKCYILVFLIIIMSLLVFRAIKRTHKLEHEGISGIAHIYELKQDVISGTVNRLTRVDFEYYYKKKRYTGSRKILNSDVSKNNCYDIIFLVEKPKVVDIFFGKEKDCPENIFDKSR